jgi:hypothetical protein
MNIIKSYFNAELENEDVIPKKTNKRNYYSVRGKTLITKDNFILKEVLMENIIECMEKKIIIIPEFQRLVNYDKIEKMYTSYNQNPNLFHFMTNPIQLAQLITQNITTYYLIDGQHRYYMYKKLYDSNINLSIRITIIKCESIEEMYNYYIKLNCDNKNNIFDEKEINTYQHILKYILLRNEMKKYYCKYFKNNDLNIYSIEEFINILKNYNFLENFKETENISNILMYIIEQNNVFYEQCYAHINYHEYKFKKNEMNLIMNKHIFALKKNNFIDFLLKRTHSARGLHPLKTPISAA